MKIEIIEVKHQTSYLIVWLEYSWPKILKYMVFEIVTKSSKS